MCTLLEEILNWIWFPNPINESLVFSFGVILAVLIKKWGVKEQKVNRDEDSNFWLIVPVGFVVAASSVYTKSDLHNHWLFGASWLMPILIYSVDFVFGITLGFLIILLRAYIWSHHKSISENFSEWLKKCKLKKDRKREPMKGKNQSDKVMPAIWDRFTPDSQISYLKNFLALMDNLTDRKSLAFWEKRKSEMEEGGFVFRVSLGDEELKKLSFSHFKDKNYLGIEFWKTREDKFEIRTTDGSTDDPKSFNAVTDTQANELMPYIDHWYLEFSDKKSAL